MGKVVVEEERFCKGPQVGSAKEPMEHNVERCKHIQSGGMNRKADLNGVRLMNAVFRELAVLVPGKVSMLLMQDGWVTKEGRFYYICSEFTRSTIYSFHFKERCFAFKAVKR